MLRSCGLVIAVALLLGACGGGGDAMQAPYGLQYALRAGQVGSPYGPYPPNVGGTVTGYSVSPALPAGLMLDPTSGVIAGTPIAASSGTYTVTASNGSGAATAALALVIHGPPTALTYASPVTATVGAALTPLVPTVSGDADTFSIKPALPDGLTLDPATGIVSGTPSRQRVAVTYTITASTLTDPSAGGASATADLLLAVSPGPAGTAVTGVFHGETVVGLGYVSGTHSGLTDTSGAYTYEVGQGIAFSVGAVSIGALATAKALVTPVDLVAQGTGPSNHVLNVVRFLMMLDQDGNPNNGIQISQAVTAAAASWVPVDFDTTDLPTALGPIIQQASAADGVSHVLPDAATAQAQLRTGFYCTHSGNYYGTFGEKRLAGDGRGDFVASVFPDGSMHSIAYGNSLLTGFNVQTNDAVSPLLDGTFAQSDDSAGVRLQGSFADPTVLSGIYLAPIGGSFEAIADASVAATYKFIGDSGSINFGMDDSNQISGDGFAGTVSGNTFTGTKSFPHTADRYPITGTYSNTASGITLDGQYSTGTSVVTFSTVGCRAN
jgi:hypothetical protein